MAADNQDTGWKPRKILKDKTVLVTGCASGLGRETARLAKAMGAHVIGVDVTKTEKHVDELYIADLSDGPTIRALVEALPDGIDGLANIAGLPPGAPAERILKVNLLGPRAFTTQMIPRLNDGAAIVNLASIAGFNWPGAVDRIRSADYLDFDGVDDFLKRHGLAGDGAATHLFAKQALIAWTLKTRWTWRDRGIRMNCVSPGLADLPQALIESLDAAALPEKNVMDRACGPEDIAPVVTFLLSDMSAWIRGTNIPVDGGLSSHLLSNIHQL